MYKIYGLTSEKDKNIIKYVGLTSKLLSKRLKQHIYTSTKKNKNKYSKKEAWIKNRISNGFEIKIFELESDLTKQEAIDLEISWISYYGLENLTNSTIGGDGINGKIYSYEEKLNWYNAIKVYQFDLNGNFICEYKTITDCAKKLNISHSSIYYGIIGKNLTSNGYFFVKNKSEIQDKLQKYNSIQTRYELYDLYGNLIDVSNSISNLNKKYKFTQKLTEFSKRLNNGIIPKSISKKYFIKFPNFNLKIMLNSLYRYKIINKKTKEIKKFIFIKDISLFLKCSDSIIIDCLSKIKKSAKGWSIKYITESDEIPEYNNIRNIVEVDLYGNIIKRFNSIKDCSNFYNIDSSCISKVCRGKRKHIKKHIFKYIDDIV